MRGEFVTVGAYELYYYAAGTRGDGDPVLFLHGLGTSSHLWRSLLPLLAGDRRYIVVDLPGHGRSGWDEALSADYLHGAASALMALLQSLRVHRVACVAHAEGAVVACRLALQNPQLLTRLAVVSAPTGRRGGLLRLNIGLERLPHGTLLRAIRTELARGYEDASLAQHSIDLYLRPWQDGAAHRRVTTIWSARGHDDDVWREPGIAALLPPPLAVIGRDDPYVSPELRGCLLERVPSATVEELPVASHFLPEEHPERVASTLERLWWEAEFGRG